MFVVRRARVEDVGVLLKLARMVHFINLPPDKDIISNKLTHSRRCFMAVAQGRSIAEDPSLPRSRNNDDGLSSTLLHSEIFMFVLEDQDSPGALGTSQLVAKMGGPDNPNVSFQLQRREFFSKSLQVGTTQITAKLYLDSSSPSEIGGLIIQPSYRAHKARLGRFLSLVRFHFIGLHRRLFADRIIAEMMAPITPEGANTLWEYLGRRFISLSYDEADRFCQYSREFMTSLLPRDEIYLSLLPPQARAIVGEVNRETVPARRMLEKLGFVYKNFIDPFDGGPHLEAQIDDIELVRMTRSCPLEGTIAASRCKYSGIISTLDSDGEFYAVNEPFHVDSQGALWIPKDVAEVLGVESGAALGITPMDGSNPWGDEPASTAKPSRTTPRKKSASAKGKKTTTKD